MSLRLFLCTTVFFGTVSFSQSLGDGEIHEAYDSMVGLENTGFYNGPEFKDAYPDSGGDSRYFNRQGFATGSIAYNGQLYPNVPLNYDVFSDNVLARSDDHLSHFIIQLIPSFISGFTIGPHNFVRLTDTKLDAGAHGFYEVAVTGKSFKLYIKHFRRKKERTVGLEVYHSFSKENYYLLHYNDGYHTINSIKDFKKVVPDRYREVQKLRRDYKSMYKSDMDGFMIRLTEHLDGY